MLWACLRFPQLALDALRIDADLPAPCASGAGSSFRSTSGSGSFPSAGPAKAGLVNAGAAPLAIIDGPQQRRHVVMANAAAAKSGVRAGQALAAAQMLCPRLATTPRDEAAERQTLESLAAWAYRYSAEIHIAGLDTLFVEVGASLALFDGWAALERRLRHELADLGFACSLAAAPTAAGARVLATHRDGITIPSPSQLPTALGIVPLTSSGLPQKTVAALQGMGFRTLADLFRLPRAELGRRIGEDSLDHLDRMRGLVGEALPRWHPPSRFERRIEFNFGIDTHTALAFPLQRLIRELALFLVTRDGGVQKFSLLLGHERGASTRVEVGLLAPQRDAASLFDLARARLERIELAAPVHALGLIADDLPPLCPLHQDLFENRRREELDWPALAERLRARLGDAALHGIASAADHRPDQAWRFVAATATPVVCRSGFSRDAPEVAKKSIAAKAAPTGKSRNRMSDSTAIEEKRVAEAVALGKAVKSRPFWLLHRPIVLRESLARILAGPERIESGWWDERDQRRDYYIVETRRGQRAWAFVEAGKRDVVNETNRIDIDAAWMLHGWFA